MTRKIKYILIAILAVFAISALYAYIAPPEPQETENVYEETPEPNTSEMVDYIIMKAKEEAEEGRSIEKAKEAFDYIKANILNPFASNEVTERLIYYGALLQYLYPNIGVGDLGRDTVKAVKYVYRGEEKAEDDATIKNIEKVKEGLYKYSYY